MISERAIIFDKIKLRYAQSVVMYGVPESVDTFMDVIGEITKEKGWEDVMKVRVNMLKNAKKDKGEDYIVKETEKLMKEKRIASMSKSIVGLFSKYDGLALERIVGTQNFKKMLTTEAKDSFTIATK